MSNRLTRSIPAALFVAVGAGCNALLGGEPRSTCIDNRNFPIGSTFFEELGDTDCLVDDRPTDQYNLKLTSPQVVRISVTNENPMANILRIAAVGDLLVETEIIREEGTTDRFLYAALGVGEYVVYYAVDGDDRGAYMMTTQSFVAPNPVACVTTSSRSFYVARGSRIDGGLTATDCDVVGGTADVFTLLAKPGSYTLNVTPTVAASIEVLDGIDVETSASAPAGATTTVTFTASAARRLTIRLSSGAVGTYSLSVD